MSKPFWWRWLRWHLSKKYRATPAKHAEWKFEILARSLGPDDVAIDCGANVGTYTALLAMRGATVYAFEPDPFAFDVLRKKFSHHPNVILINKAVGAHDGKVQLYRSADFDTDPVVQSQSSSLLPFKKNVDPARSVDVEQIDFAHFLKSLGRPVSILKIDIEGGEFDLINRMLDEGCLASVASVFVETHDHKIPQLRETGAALRARLAKEPSGKVVLDWR